MKSPTEIKLPELIRRKTNEILSCVKKQKAVYENYWSLYTCKQTTTTTTTKKTKKQKKNPKNKTKQKIEKKDVLTKCSDLNIL